MFISNTEAKKKFVTIVQLSVCAILTVAVCIAFIFSVEKRPFIVLLPVILLIDIVWVLVYIFYIRKLK